MSRCVYIPNLRILHHADVEVPVCRCADKPDMLFAWVFGTSTSALHDLAASGDSPLNMCVLVHMRVSCEGDVRAAAGSILLLLVLLSLLLLLSSIVITSVIEVITSMIIMIIVTETAAPT